MCQDGRWPEAQAPLHVTCHGTLWVTVGHTGPERRTELVMQGQGLDSRGLCSHQTLSVLWMLLPES